jgi:hypothetical protein
MTSATSSPQRRRLRGRADYEAVPGLEQRNDSFAAGGRQRKDARLLVAGLVTGPRQRTLQTVFVAQSGRSPEPRDAFGVERLDERSGELLYVLVSRTPVSRVLVS